jgi:hypothetical protein
MLEGVVRPPCLPASLLRPSVRPSVTVRPPARPPARPSVRPSLVIHLHQHGLDFPNIFVSLLQRP